MSGQIQDAEAKNAALYALSYFVGQYEGATGRSVLDGHDEAAVTEVALDPDKFTAICSEHMQQYGPRMVEWGGVLNELGQRLQAEQNAAGGR